jgi:hypothetical protein
MNEIPKDEEVLLRHYRTAKAAGHADIEVSLKDGKMVKLWTTNKADLNEVEQTTGKLKEIENVR